MPPLFNNLVECSYTNDYISKYANEYGSLDNDKKDLSKIVSSMQFISNIWVYWCFLDMRLSENTLISPEKLTDYLLVFKKRNDKSGGLVN